MKPLDEFEIIELRRALAKLDKLDELKIMCEHIERFSADLTDFEEKLDDCIELLELCIPTEKRKKK